MKITNTETGKSYQLFPDTKLSIERTNPFFNEYGEQSVPVSIPDTEYNRNILSQPQSIERREKIKVVEASISSGNFFSKCRQAILSITPGENIETSFYLNDGSFYSKLENTYIVDVFGEETIPEVNSVEEAISFIKSLFKYEHDNYAVFQVEISSSDSGELRFLNAYNENTDKLIAEEEQTETIDGKIISLPAGFYLTPFIKANYVLKRIFNYFGYTLNDNFFTQTAQFNNLVFINNVADAVVTGKIKLAQLLPDVTCKDILELFRKKFLCEFVTDEVRMTVDIVLLNEILDNNNAVNLSGSLSGKISVEFPESYKQIILESENTISEEKNFESLAVIRSKYPSCYFEPKRGNVSRKGFNMNTFGYEFEEVVADSSQRYYEGGNLDTMKIQIPECIPVDHNYCLYIGEEQFLNSALKSSSSLDETSSDSEDKESSTSMYLMLAFVYRSGKKCGGTVTNFGVTDWINGTYVQIGDYSLVYNGENGIFEKFYRKYDTLLRNSLHECKASFILTDSEKISIPSVSKIHVKGSDFILNSMSYEIGEKSGLSEMSLLTTKLYEPVSSAKKIDDLLPPPPSGLKWVLKQNEVSIPGDEYQNSPYKDAVIADVYPPEPKQELIGKRFYESKSAVQVLQSYILVTSWLEVVKD